MALDLLMLEDYPTPTAFRLRHYGWENPAVTFGYSQPYAEVRAVVPTAIEEVIRRPTGGGVVDHRADWTYALVIPAGHPLARAQVAAPYRLVHTALANALRSLGQDSLLQKAEGRLQIADYRLQMADGGRMAEGTGLIADGSGQGAEGRDTRARVYAAIAQCFVDPSPDDIMSRTGLKIAGAALKRNRHGLLLQGSVARAAAPHVHDWKPLPALFAGQLAELLSLSVATPSALPFPTETIARSRAHFADAAWNRRR
ncbi:MAG: lipoate--protein ligase family protein [Verrucomicrobiota bacterium]|nr:lipoate--protein ligase family protein [Verrucomicrobiota bacterium]